MSTDRLPRAVLRISAPLRPRWRRLLWLVAFGCGVLAITSFAGAAQRGGTNAVAVAAGSSGSDPALVGHGHALFESSCASCHGIDAQGIHGRAPSLHGVGALAADFYLETGRMPLPSPRAQPQRTRPAFPPAQIRALIAYVASFGGPPTPTVRLVPGSISRGQELFALSCAGCHTIQAIGGIVTGAVAPSLIRATPRQVAEAIRIGPYVMPVFGPAQLSNADVAAIATYVERTNHAADNAGGWSIGRIGPISEGMVTWLLAIAALLIIARLLGERLHTSEEEG
jgi:ubiquinol-cytochrome c reductase cytochrome c subunit